MHRDNPVNLNLDRVPTPCFVIDEGQLQRNLSILENVRKRAGCKILLALKGFAMFSVFPLLRKTLDGVCASSLNEARLGWEEFGKEVHIFAPAYSESDLNELLQHADHLVFNSFSQWTRFRERVKAADRKIKCGIRINPEHSEVEIPLYNPCAAGSRLGVRRQDFTASTLLGISGLHFHTLCEKNADALLRTVRVVEEKFGDFIPQMEWMNFGGGHQITHSDYDIDLLCNIILEFRKKFGVEVYLEPGEAVALNSGILVTTVLDIVHNDMDIAILDSSASTHMPDVLEAPYRPMVIGSGLPGEKAYTYRLAGVTCLAGDVIGEYSFDAPLKIGNKLIFLDMGHYSMVKTTTFNGVNLPAIALYRPQTDEFKVIRQFGYADYKSRLS